MRILVVDDNVHALYTLCRLLEAAGHALHCTHEPQTALAPAIAFRPEAIIIDIGMPALDGYELAKQLRAASALEGVPIIALSGYGSKEAWDRSREAGISAHLIKPSSLAELQATLRRLANR
jgi:CheY-like chemotaxis protein